jgi:multisubunit Na+/H+ antiporter MnhB subunit
MTMAVLFDVGLAVFLLGIAGWIISTRSAFTAAVVFVVYGLLLSLAWVRLSAVDVALTEAAIGSGVTGMLLLGAAARLRATEAATEISLPMRLAAGAFCALISAGLAALMIFPPEVAPTLAPPALAHLAQSGLGNPVAGVLFVYRALDTLLEKVVLLLALVGVWSLARDRVWGGAPGLRVWAPPNSVLVLLAQLLPPIGIMFGIYMFWVGADAPGGAFQGGAVLAAMWLLVMIAGLRDVPAIGLLRLRMLLVLGPVIFLAIGLAGFGLAGAFLAYPAGYAKPLIIVVEATLTLSIGVTLGLLVAGPPERVPQP